MKPVIVYPIPFDQWDTFQPFVERFTKTFKEFPPGCDYELHAVCNWGEPSDEVRSWFYGIKTRFVPYFENGCDIGSAQQVAKAVFSQNKENGTFILAMTSRCYFHRQGWLRRYMEAREKHGPGMYGASASWEGGKPHVCTRAYGLDADLFAIHPHTIDTREKGQKFEVGEWCVSDFIRNRGLPLVQVTWDGEQLFPHWRPESEKGIFRRGSQSAMLVWDKHTDVYDTATEEDRKCLERMADTPSFSQAGEDRWIIENLNPQSTGVFVDVGAHDGISSSNTFAFENMGWSGVCIEADPELAEQCRKNRNCNVVVCAAGNEHTEATFYVNKADRGLSGLTRPGDPIKVDVRKLGTILKRFDTKEIDLLSVDTEGTELDVLDGLGEYVPKVVIIEHQTCELPSKEAEIRAYMVGLGYKLRHATAHNLIFTIR